MPAKNMNMSHPLVGKGLKLIKFQYSHSFEIQLFTFLIRLLIQKT